MVMEIGNIPPFGFESFECRDTIKSKLILDTVYPDYSEISRKTDAESAWKTRNTAKILSWLPVVCIVIGIIFILNVCNAPLRPGKCFPNKAEWITRGIMQIFCLTPLLFIIDVIMSIVIRERARP